VSEGTRMWCRMLCKSSSFKNTPGPRNPHLESVLVHTTHCNHSSHPYTYTHSPLPQPTLPQPAFTLTTPSPHPTSALLPPRPSFTPASPQAQLSAGLPVHTTQRPEVGHILAPSILRRHATTRPARPTHAVGGQAIAGATHAVATVHASATGHVGLLPAGVLPGGGGGGRGGVMDRIGWGVWVCELRYVFNCSKHSCLLDAVDVLHVLLQGCA
jgi:hypothetical protein